MSTIHDSSMHAHTSQDAFPLCVIKNLVSVRLYSAPHLHLIIVIILNERPSSVSDCWRCRHP